MNQPTDEASPGVSEEDDAIAGVMRGLTSMRQGEGRPMREALEELGRRHGIELCDPNAVALPESGE